MSFRFSRFKWFRVTQHMTCHSKWPMKSRKISQHEWRHILFIALVPFEDAVHVWHLWDTLYCKNNSTIHDDVIKWKHFPRNWPFVLGIHRSRWIPHTKASDAELWCFSFIYVWINGWVNNHEAGDLRRHRGHYDVNVMIPIDLLHMCAHFCYKMVHCGIFVWCIIRSYTIQG